MFSALPNLLDEPAQGGSLAAVTKLGPENSRIFKFPNPRTMAPGNLMIFRNAKTVARESFEGFMFPELFELWPGIGFGFSEC
jgi:hypothetical protein